MPLTATQEEAVRKLAKERAENNLAETVDALEEAVQGYLEDQHRSKVVRITEKVLTNLENRGIDTSRENVSEIAAKSVIDVLSGDFPTVDVPVAGRANQDSTRMTFSVDYETKTVDVPLRGGDVEEPETIEVEVPDPEPVTLDVLDVLDDIPRINREPTEDDDGYDIPAAGENPRYIR